MKRLFGASWRSSLMGYLCAGIIVVDQIHAAMDPERDVNVESLLMAVTVAGLGYVSRDNKVRSEEAGL